MNLYVPGLRGKAQVTTHVLLWIIVQTGIQDPDDLYLAYLEFAHSGLTLDHLCVNPACRNPDHLDPCDGPENTRRAFARRRGLPIT